MNKIKSYANAMRACILDMSLKYTEAFYKLISGVGQYQSWLSMSLSSDDHTESTSLDA